MKAIWNNKIIAESDATIVIENNHYFPADSVSRHLLIPSATKTICPWKGEACYHTVTIDGKELTDAAWYYPQPKEAAANIANYVAFWKGVKVVES